MRDITVKEIMVPLSEYETVSTETTLHEAAVALALMQHEHDRNHKIHRLLMITDMKGKVVGKCSQLDILRALQPKEVQLDESGYLSRFGVSQDYLKPMMDLCGFWSKPLIDLCREAGDLKVESLVHSPKAGEYINENATIPEAIEQLVVENHQSLLVVRGEEIIGIVRQTDLFREVVKTLSACKI